MNNRFVLFLLLNYVFLLQGNGQGFAQNYLTNIQYYGVNEGLSHREVYSIYQDKNGFLWIGTQYGLNRFDGHSFKWWTKEKQGLASNQIHYLLEDDDEWLWAISVENWFHRNAPTHVSLVHTKTGEVRTMEDKFGASLPFSLEDLSTIYADENHTLYISLKTGELYAYRSASGFQKINLPKAVSVHPALGGTTSQGEFLLWGYSHYSEGKARDLLAVSPVTGELFEFYTFDKEVKFIRLLRQDDKQRLWLTINKEGELPQLHYFDMQTKALHRYDMAMLDHLELKWHAGEWSQQLFYQPQKDFFWFKSSPNLFVFHEKDGLIYNFRNRTDALIEADIHTLFFDNANVAWAGTANGLYQINLNQNPFFSWLNLDYSNYSLGEAHSCRGIWANEEQLWVNTYKGRYEMERLVNSKPERLPFITNGKFGVGPQFLMYYPLAVLGDQQENATWFSDFTLVKRDRETKQETVFRWDKTPGDITNNIWSLHQAEDGAIWLGTENGLGILDTACQCLRLATDEHKLSGTTIHAFVERKDGTLWLATNRGLYLWSAERGIIHHYRPAGSTGYQLPHDNILHLHETQDTLWLATGGGGLLEVALERESLKIDSLRQYTIADGLPNNFLYAVYEDDFDRLWVSSDFGIISFHKRHKQVKTYLPKDGITHIEFNRTSHFQTSDGTIYFGGLNGVTAFDPKDFQRTEEPLETPLRIVDFQQLDGQSGKLINRTKELLADSSINLLPADRFFRLQFALLHFEGSNQQRYAWKVEGLDEDWNYSTENFLRMSGLPAGSYLLKIKGQAADGRWSRQEIHLPLLVQLYFYEKPSFWIMLSLLLLIGLGVFYKWRTNRLKRRQQELEADVAERTETIRQQSEELVKMDRAKSRFFANVSHELRTPLTLILGPLNSLLKQKKQEDRDQALLELARENGQNLLQLVNSILDLSSLEAGKLDLQEKPVMLYPLLHRLVSQFESNAQIQGVVLELDYRPDKELQLQLDTGKFEMIVNNLLSNALKFTNTGGSIKLLLESQQNSIKLTVADTGRGIHPEDLPNVFDRYYQSKQLNARVEGGSGIGLAICKEYAERFGGSISVESELGKGSSFFFVFPKKVAVGAPEITGLAATEKNALTTVIPAESRASADSPLILLVEDNHSLRAYLKMILGQYYRLITAENGQVALNYLGEQFEPDLIISDVMMPIMDGFELLDRLKSSDQWRHLPVVMLTARAEWRDKLRALRIGVDDYILKPFNEEELLARVENLINNHRERKAVIESQEAAVEDRPRLSSADDRWLQEQEALLMEHYADSNFTATQWAGRVFLSERQLQRKIKALTGLSPYHYLAELRMTEARKFLEDRHFSTVAEVAYAVGFTNTQSFSRNFSKRFGRTPSSYLG